MSDILDSDNSGLSEDNDRIIQTDLRNEMSRSYLEYAMSVIVGRALPDARDGLKPVHRRILYAMYELGLTSGRPYRKCARVVGEVLGKYHPHGDTAVYDALVRMAQDFSMRMPLIDGHGNFGSVDNDPPAAMRYTESRLQSLTDESLLEDIESETVDFADNFDGSQQEPTVLPARVPQLLLNGSSGIAVGMATNNPTHYLGELINGIKSIIKKPSIEINLKYNSGSPVINTIERISKPGRRIFSSADSLPKINNGLGIAILSTPKGVMTDIDARKQKVGGEIVCKVF